MGKKVSEVPHLLKMWDFEKNGDEQPDQVSVSLEQPRFWKCPDCGYAWEAGVRGRYRSSGKCPCHESNKVIMKGINDAITIVDGLSDLLDEDNDFDAISSEGLDSSLLVNYHCKECGRKWTATLKSQTKKDGHGGYKLAGCPHYNTVKRKKDEVPFCSEVESLARFWDDANEMDPKTTKSNSEEKAHFICKKCGYDWTCTIRGQVRSTGKCKCCELQRVTKKDVTDVFTLVPEAKRFFDSEKNKGIDIHSIPIRDTTTQILWTCPDCGYEWISPLAYRIDGKKDLYRFVGCQQCYLHGTDRITPASSDPKITKYWDFEANKLKDINLTSVHSNATVGWRCKECGYKWTQTIRTFHDSDCGCPACAGKRSAILKGKNDIFTICPEIETIYDFETNECNGIDAYSLAPNSKTVVHFKCKKCNHEWDSPIANRMKIRNGVHVFVDCPECSNKRTRQIPYSEEFPELAKMYRVDLNEEPLDSIRGLTGISYTLRKWECPTCGEVFDSTLNAMRVSINTSTKGCPYCSHTKLRKDESFAALHPDLLKEYDLNNKINPIHVFPNDKTPVSWVCHECGYKWTSSFALRHMGYGKCAVCNRSTLIKEENSFAAVYPALIQYWADSNDRKPDEVFYNSSEWFQFNCPTCGKEHGSYISDFVSEDGHCPYCRHVMVDPERTSLKALHPDVARRYSDNNDRPADQLFPTSYLYKKWICDTCHGEYGSPVRDAVADIDECPYCKGTRVLPGFNSIQVKSPKLAALLSPLNEKNADQILDHSGSVHLWRCPDCGGDYHATPLDIENGYECPYCRGTKILPGFNSLQATDPELAALISPLNEKTADYVMPHTNTLHLWRCPDCGNDYHATALDMENGYSCPYCRGTKILPEFNSLQATDPELAALISPLNEKTADYVMPHTNTLHLWRCPDCGGDYHATPLDMENGYDCPYCDNRLLLKGFNSFADRHPDLLEEMDEIANYLYPYTPEDVLDTSSNPFWWKCKNNPKHHYRMSVKTRLLFQERGRESCMECRGFRRNRSHFMPYTPQKKSH